MSGLIRLFLIIAISLMLHACGGGDAETPWDSTGDTTTDAGTGDGTGDGTDDGTGGDPTSPASLSFVSANPSQIGIKGFGLDEVSRLTFELVDDNNLGILGQSVSFELNTTIGGITLSPATGTTDADGLVTVDVTSGTIATPVTVTARLVPTPTIFARSEGLIISTGIGVQKNMSLSAEIHNPEGWGYDGVTVGLRVIASDQFGNPVQDGTGVSFITEGGQVQSSCFTADGTCSVNWTSGEYRPTDGRVTVLATMIGEEAFLDANSNGVLDDGDTFGVDPYNNMPEPWLDANNDGAFNIGQEVFVSTNGDTVYDGADGNFNGILCCDSAAVAAASAAGEGACLNVTPYTAHPCGGENDNKIHIRDESVLVMSGSFATIEAVTFYHNTSEVSPNPNTLYVDGGEGSVDISIYDLHGNSMPNGTTVALETTNGEITSKTSYTVQDALGPMGITVSVKPDDEVLPPDNTGKLTITVTTPRGNESVATINIVDG